MKMFGHRISGRALRSSLLLALAICLLAASGLLHSPERRVQDALFQQAEALDGAIVVVGVTASDLEVLGPWPWDRSVMAQVVGRLNERPENRPAAIGLDAVFASETTAQADRALAQAAVDGNLIVACSADFDSRLEFAADGAASMQAFRVGTLSMPYDALRDAAAVGHINAMYDSDGVLRHHLWSLRLEDGSEMPSLPYQMYQRYCEYWGLAADFSPPRNAQGFWYVPYTAAPGAYYEYSILDILNGNFTPEVLTGNLVLVGPYEMGLSDEFVTAIDRAERMYGVEYMANCLDAMVRGLPKRELPASPQWALVGVICFLLCLCVLTVPLWQGALLCLLVAGGGLWGSVIFYANGIVLRPLWLPLGAVACCLLGVLSHYAAALRDKRHVRSVFERYVDPDILQELFKQDPRTLRLAGKQYEIAVLFVDLRGFTALSEGLAPEKVVEILNEYLSLTDRCIRQNRGTLDKFVGDCTMAFWGAPLPAHDPVAQACRAAMDMVRDAQELSDSIFKRYERTVSFGVGIHFGPAVVGNIGSENRLDYTAVGDTVNTAARLESIAPPGCVYISRAVADGLGSRGETISLGRDLYLKGKTEPFEVLALKAVHADQTQVIATAQPASRGKL